MLLSHSIVYGRLIKRYKRFLADVQLKDGQTVTAHCTNSGSMKSCIEEDARVILSISDNPKRKTKYTWEMIEIKGKWVGVNTALPNQFAFWALENNKIEGLNGFDLIKREVKFHDSRIDLYGEKDGEKCYIEVKSVTHKVGMRAEFPDAVTTRGQKHLRTLQYAKEQGMRAVMLYIVERMDVDIFAPAESIDPEYARLLRESNEKGVEIFALQVELSPTEIKPHCLLPVDLS